MFHHVLNRRGTWKTRCSLVFFWLCVTVPSGPQGWPMDTDGYRGMEVHAVPDAVDVCSRAFWTAWALKKDRRDPKKIAVPRAFEKDVILFLLFALSTSCLGNPFETNTKTKHARRHIILDITRLYVILYIYNYILNHKSAQAKGAKQYNYSSCVNDIRSHRIYLTSWRPSDHDHHHEPPAKWQGPQVLPLDLDMVGLVKSVNRLRPFETCWKDVLWFSETFKPQGVAAHSMCMVLEGGATNTSWT